MIMRVDTVDHRLGALAFGVFYRKGIVGRRVGAALRHHVVLCLAYNIVESGVREALLLIVVPEQHHERHSLRIDMRHEPLHGHVARLGVDVVAREDGQLRFFLGQHVGDTLQRGIRPRIIKPIVQVGELHDFDPASRVEPQGLRLDLHERGKAQDNKRKQEVSHDMMNCGIYGYFKSHMVWFQSSEPAY